MPIKRIDEFPEGSGSLTNDDILLFMDDPSGSGITKKISLSEVGSLIGSGGGGSGNPFDQNLNTTDFPTFSGISLSNGTTLAQGTFDNNTGGNNGISLNCYVGYELNWQGGHLRSTPDAGVTTASIICDSPIEFPGSGINNLTIDGSGILFNDGTTQLSASVVVSGVGSGSIVGLPNLNNNAASGDYSIVAGGSSNTIGSTSYNSSILGGLSNQIASPAEISVIVGGEQNINNGNHSFIGGGFRNQCSGVMSIVVGGGNFDAMVGNSALADNSVVVGGYNNVASGVASFIGGGISNIAGGALGTVVAGGSQNVNNGDSSTIGGGAYNTINYGFGSVIGGGYTNTIYLDPSLDLYSYGTICGGESCIIGSGTTNNFGTFYPYLSRYAFIGGGRYNFAQYDYSVVVGGSGNAVTTTNGVVVGGENNYTNGPYGFLGGGYGNHAANQYSSIVGGQNNATSGDYSFIGGGSYNVTVGNYSVIGGGGDSNCPNVATGVFSAILGGACNYTYGYSAGVVCGQVNTASGDYSFIGAGLNNIADSNYSSIIGGNNNNTSGQTNCHIIGSGITADAADTTFVNNLKITNGGLVILNIPTSDPGVLGALWNDNDTLKISAGPPP